jgi:2-polyprenyl-6-methoxyphenol hydroxylase-like FAD-dependent oxidoreductase
MRVLISGAGIAGPTLAYWLARYGFAPTIVEAAPRLRTGGYLIDFWGVAYDIAERMGLLPKIKRNGFVFREFRAVNAAGQRVSGFPVSAFSRMTHGRYISLARSELSAIIFGALSGKVETIFGDSVNHLEQSGEIVRVNFARSSPRDFDLVVGADGLHSQVRELVFGPENQFEKYLGYKVASFAVHGYRPRDELVYMTYTQVGQQVGRYAIGDDCTMFLFIFADDNIALPSDLANQKALLRRRFGNCGWECPQILEALGSANELYFDRVSQIHMDAQQGLWTSGRITLIGDAASCVSLLAGQGSALAMIAAYILAGELHRASGDHFKALARYQALFAPFVLRKQKAALRFAGAFAPKSKFGLFLRNQIFRLMNIPWVAALAAGRDLADRIALPNYE